MVVKSLKISVLLICTSVASGAFASDPRLENENTAACFEQAKRFLSSSDYHGENESQVLAACKDVEADCVSELGQSLHPSDGTSAKEFLKLIRACEGNGTGKCLRGLINKTASYNRREYQQLHDLLKKCQ